MTPRTTPPPQLGIERMRQRLFDGIVGPLEAEDSADLAVQVAQVRRTRGIGPVQEVGG